MTVSFRNDGVMVTTERDSDGTTNIVEEHYRVVDNTLIISKPGYIINAKYRISGRKMSITSPEFRAELERM